MNLRRVFFSVLSAFAVMASANSARADFSLYVLYGAGSVLEIQDNGLGDDDLAVGSISANTEFVETEIGGGFDFAALGGKSNATAGTGTPSLTQTYELTGTGSLTIVAAANNYLQSISGAVKVTSRGTSIFGSSDTADFFSSIDPTNAAISSVPVGTMTSVLTFAGPGEEAKSNSTSAVLIGSFGLYNSSTFTLAGNSLQFTGRTEVTAIPEPASMAMLAIGGLGVLGAARRRRQA